MMRSRKTHRPPATIQKVRSFGRDNSGNIATTAAIMLSLVVTLAAFAVDEGALYLQRRHAQTLTDLAAIAAAGNPDDPAKAARQFLNDNGLKDFDLTVEDEGIPFKKVDRGASTYVTLQPGHYAGDPATKVQDRFQPGATPTNAVKVTMRQDGALYFAQNLLKKKPVIQTVGVARADAAAAFSIGSRLVKVDGGILNAVLNGLLGTNLSLSAMDYEALVSANVDALQFFDALASKINLKAGTYNDLLNSRVSIAQIASALAAVSRSGDGTATNAMAQIAGQQGARTLTLPLSHLFGLGPLGNMAIGTGTAALSANVGMMDVLTAAAAVANGQHQVQLDLGAQLPGLASLTVDLAIGEPPQHSPWFAVGDRGEIVRTAQTKLYLQASVGGSGLLAGLKLRLPVYLELAYGEARLADVSCPTGRPESADVEIDARPGIAELWIADVDTTNMNRFYKSPPVSEAEILKAPLIKVSALGHIKVGNTRYQRLSFDYSDIEDGRYQTVTTQQYVSPLLTSLLKDTKLDVRIAGIGVSLPPSQVRQAVLDTLTPVADTLDSVVYQLLSALGVKLGQADVWANGVMCQRPVLVQ